MIYTLTFNPALDYVITTGYNEGELNKIDSEEIIFGGKGINVSRVLSNFSMPTKCLGFISGFTGLALENFMRYNHVETDFIKLKTGYTRINIKLNNGILTEFNGNGPEISELDIHYLMSKISKLTKKDMLVISGSTPRNVPTDTYKKIVELCHKIGVKVCVDCDGELFTEALKAKPDLVKPKKQTVEGMFNIKIFDLDDVKDYAKKLQDMGAKNVILTLGDEGAYLLNEKKQGFFTCAPEGIVFNTIGSGDSLLAGFIYAKELGLDDEKALTLGVYCGSATVFTSELCTKDEVTKLLERDNIKLF